jgi:hypothetical protein
MTIDCSRTERCAPVAWSVGGHSSPTRLPGARTRSAPSASWSE